MPSKFDTKEVKAAFKKAASDPAVQAIAVGAFKYALTSGVRRGIDAQGFPPLSEEYVKSKIRRGLSPLVWQASGGTIAALSNNAPAKFGTKKGLKFSINKKNLFVSAFPRAFTDSKGKRYNVKRQAIIFNTLRYGTKKKRIASSGSKSRGTPGPTPGRHIIGFNDAWKPTMIADIEDAMVKNMKGIGFDAK